MGVNVNMVLCGLDLGASNIRASAACIDKKGGIQLLGLEAIRTSCINCGEIIDFETACSDIKEVLSRLEKKIGHKIRAVHAAINDPLVTTLEAKGMVVLGNKPRAILQQDIDRSIRYAKMIMLPPDKKIIHTIVHGYYLNEGERIPNPIGYSATKLTTKVYVILQDKSKIKSITKCIENSGRACSGVMLSIMAVGEAVIPNGSVSGAPLIIDVGSSVTTIALFHGKTLIYLESLQKGGRDLSMPGTLPEFLNTLSRLVKGRNFEKVIFTSGGALIENLVESAEEVLGVPCEAGHVRLDWCSVGPSDSMAHEASLGVIAYNAERLSKEPSSNNPIPKVFNYVNNIVEQYF